MPSAGCPRDTPDETGSCRQLLPLPPPVVGVGKAVDLQVAPKTAGMRLDQYLVLFFPDYSRAVVQRAIEAAAVTVNGLTSKPSYRVRQNDNIHITVPEPTHP